MIFTVARIKKINEINFDKLNRTLFIKYENSHRATGGRQFEVVFEGESLDTLLANISQLDQPAGRVSEVRKL